MEKSRFEVAKTSKFESLTNKDLQSVKGGGICFSCMKQTKKWAITIGPGKPNHVPGRPNYSRTIER